MRGDMFASLEWLSGPPWLIPFFTGETLTFVCVCVCKGGWGWVVGMCTSFDWFPNPSYTF